MDQLIACNGQPIEYDELDPGIREVVRRLRAAGFETCDSGDGKSKPPEEGSEMPHVIMNCPRENLFSEADRLAAEVATWGLAADHGYSVMASYEPEIGGVGFSTLQLFLVTDSDLQPVSHP